MDIILLLEFSNEILSAAIVIIAVSMLLYNLTRNAHDRVNRASSFLLAAVTVAYIADVFISADPGPNALETWFRLQWIGLALVPATMFHLSDALLATTGLVSRGRRRRAVRALYAVGVGFIFAALTTNAVIKDLTKDAVWHMKPGGWFWVYVLYFLIAVSVGFFNVLRARRRCLTTYTRRRMTYLMATYLMPAWGLFPYSLLFSAIFEQTNTIPEGLLWFVFNVANLIVLATLAFMAYPLSFFGAYKPDRVVKAELLEFMLRGPMMGVIIIVLIQTLPSISNILGIQGVQFTSFAAVAIILFFQWMITVYMPSLERLLIFNRDHDQAHRLREISDRLITGADTIQLQEAILAAICDLLRVDTAFIAPASNGDSQLEQVGQGIAADEKSEVKHFLISQFSSLDPTNPANTDARDRIIHENNFYLWRRFWLVPLYHHEDEDTEVLVGVLGIGARSINPDLLGAEARLFESLRERTAELLADIQLQNRVLTGLADLVAESSNPLQTVNVTPFGHVDVQNVSPMIENPAPTPTSSLNESYIDLVKDALRDYWGGPKLTENKLMYLNVVEREIGPDENRVHALRRVLERAIENLRPDGKQNLNRPDWILYNILEMRFLQGRKVRDVAPRLAMSSADFYRKQRHAIQEVARIIAENERQLMEREKTQGNILPDVLSGFLGTETAELTKSSSLLAETVLSD